MSSDPEEPSYHVLSTEELVSMSVEPGLWDRVNDQDKTHSSLEFWGWTALCLAGGWCLHIVYGWMS